MDPKLDELTQSFVIGAAALAAFVYIARTATKWIGAEQSPMQVFKWIEELFEKESPQNGGGANLVAPPAPTQWPIKVVDVSKAAILLVVVYGLGLFMYDISHDFGAERHNWTAAIDEYMDSDSSLRLRSLFDVPIGTRNEARIRSVSLYADMIAVTSEYPKDVQGICEKLRVQIAPVRSGPALLIKTKELTKLKSNVNQLFYAAKNTVYRNREYCAELRDLEARSGFFRALFFLTLICLVCSIACRFPTIEITCLKLGVAIVAIVSPIVYFFDFRALGISHPMHSLVAEIYNADKQRLQVLGSRFVLWIYQYLTLLPLVACVVGLLMTSRWSRQKLQYKMEPSKRSTWMTVFLLFVFHSMSGYTYVQEITNYNRRVFGYFQSMAVDGAFATSSGLKADAASQGILSVLYFQTSGEYVANCLQAFNSAKSTLADKLKTRKSELPPAVICDLDETLLDNSAFQSWLITARKSYSEELWQKFAIQCQDEVRAVPGAVKFVTFAYEKGVPVFFVTNRRAVLKDATIKTIERLGMAPKNAKLGDRLFFLADDAKSTDKRSRIKELREKHDVLLLIGDSLKDFGSDSLNTAETGIKSIVEEDESRWGTDWIVLPNPIYGDWERRAAAYPRQFLLRSRMATIVDDK